VPVILFECSARGELRAFWPAMKNVFAVIAGIPNHSASITTTQPTMNHRISGTERQAQIAYSPWNSHASGRAEAGQREHRERPSVAAGEVAVHGAEAQRDYDRVRLRREDEVEVLDDPSDAKAASTAAT